MARTRGLGAHHDQRRAEIADAVLAVVADGGLQAVSQAEVAARAGVSPGRVQHYFPTKQQLIEAAFNRGNAQSAARIRAKVGHRDLRQAMPRAVVTTVLSELIAYDASTRAHLRVRHWFNALALSDAAIANHIHTQYADFHHQIAELIRRDQTTGLIPTAHDPHRAAVTLVALAEGLSYYVLIEAYPAAAATQRILDAIADLYK